MIINAVLPHTISFKGLTQDANKISSYTDKLPANRPCLIEQITDQETSVDDNVLANEYNCYMNDISGVVANDIATDQDGVEYDVKGVSGYPYSVGENYQLLLARR